jgi:hypothetical protein
MKDGYLPPDLDVFMVYVEMDGVGLSLGLSYQEIMYYLVFYNTLNFYTRSYVSNFAYGKCSKCSLVQTFRGCPEAVSKC